jgi:hypothetical protein
VKGGKQSSALYDVLSQKIELFMLSILHELSKYISLPKVINSKFRE